jgi:NAD-dependent dihydropyrimidine dehydrogenase PreA subunit
LCEFCIKHGEGKKWYEIMENYSQEMFAEQGRKEYLEQFVLGIRENAGYNLKKLHWAKEKSPIAYRFVRKMGTWWMKKMHFGQVVSLEDAERIVDMVQSVTRVPCVCRSVTTGKQDARYCLLLGIDPLGLNHGWAELNTHLETLSREKAKELLRDFDKKGLVHSIWTFKTPFIGAICNCDHDCLAYKLQVSQDLMDIMFKGEYTAKVDPLQCIGCRLCQRLCQFGAIEYSSINDKCVINPLKCYGCGLCRRGCKKEAINLQ